MPCLDVIPTYPAPCPGECCSKASYSLVKIAVFLVLLGFAISRC